MNRYSSETSACSARTRNPPCSGIFRSSVAFVLLSVLAVLICLSEAKKEEEIDLAPAVKFWGGSRENEEGFAEERGDSRGQYSFFSSRLHLIRLAVFYDEGVER